MEHFVGMQKREKQGNGTDNPFYGRSRCPL